MYSTVGLIMVDGIKAGSMGVQNITVNLQQMHEIKPEAQVFKAGPGLMEGTVIYLYNVSI